MKIFLPIFTKLQLFPKQAKGISKESARLLIFCQIVASLMNFVQVLYYLLGPSSPVFREGSNEDIVSAKFEHPSCIKVLLLRIYCA